MGQINAFFGLAVRGDLANGGQPIGSAIQRTGRIREQDVSTGLAVSFDKDAYSQCESEDILQSCYDRNKALPQSSHDKKQSPGAKLTRLNLPLDLGRQLGEGVQEERSGKLCHCHENNALTAKLPQQEQGPGAKLLRQEQSTLSKQTYSQKKPSAKVATTKTKALVQSCHGKNKALVQSCPG